MFVISAQEESPKCVAIAATYGEAECDLTVLLDCDLLLWQAEDARIFQALEAMHLKIG